MSLKTGYRDLNDLQLAGFPLYAEEGESGRRWKFIDTYRFELPQPFTFTELMSLHLSRGFFKIFRGTLFYESIQSLFDKVRTFVLDRIKMLRLTDETFEVPGGFDLNRKQATAESRMGYAS